jgi:hypothetical protein
MTATVKRMTRKDKSRIQAAALRALHERGHFTSDERATEVDRCPCGGIVWGTDLLCSDCVRKRHRQK